MTVFVIAQNLLMFIVCTTAIGQHFLKVSTTFGRTLSLTFSTFEITFLTSYTLPLTF